MQEIAAKWRPTLGMITAALIAAALLLPLIGLVFMRLYENQLIRQTEAELIAQAAVLTPAFAAEIEAAPEAAFPLGLPRPPLDPARAVDERYAPITPSLDLASSPVLPARPPAAQAARPLGPDAILAGEKLSRITREAQITTLAGFRLLDATGRVVAGAGDVGRSFEDLAEVRTALGGDFASVLRNRGQDRPSPPLYSISRGTEIRVFIAMPVFVDDRVRGVVYISRTPDNIVRNLYSERERLTLAAALIAAAAAFIGFIFVRTITRPVSALARRAEAITLGDRAAIGPLPHHGTHELAALTQSFMTMAKRLSERSDYLSTFAAHVTHELKTPLTSIRGAAELMLDAGEKMSAETRQRFLDNVLSDAARMTALLDSLRELARADNPVLGGVTTLRAVADALKARFENLHISVNGDDALPMSLDNALIVFGHLADNAAKHGAARFDLAIVGDGARDVDVRVRDDGAGVSPANRAHIFDPFFTTRRDQGGTGMGLGIVRALMRAHGGDILLEDSAAGACFLVRFLAPSAPPPARRRWNPFAVKSGAAKSV